MSMHQKQKDIFIYRLMTMSPLYLCGKLYSTGTLNEAVKNLTLSPACDRLNHDRMTAVALFNSHSSERKCSKNHVKQTFNQKLCINLKKEVYFTLWAQNESFNTTFSMF